LSAGDYVKETVDEVLWFWFSVWAWGPIALESKRCCKGLWCKEPLEGTANGSD